jgi:hypothetical protein
VPWDENEPSETTAARRADKRVKKDINKTASSEPESIDNLLKTFNIPPQQWDYLIVGDGSGTTWQQAAGWGSF